MSTATFTLVDASCAGSVSRVSQQLIGVDPGRDVAVQQLGRHAIATGDVAFDRFACRAAIEPAGHSHADFGTATKETRS